MSILCDVLNACKVITRHTSHRGITQENWQIFSRKFGTNDLSYESVYGITILVANCNVLTENKIKKLIFEINAAQPTFIWLIECYKDINLSQGYVHIKHNDIHQNHLFIKEKFYFGRTISRIDYGIKVDNICFRYIPPGRKKTKLDGDIEIGDYNPKSNKWINFKYPFTCECRNGSTGGVLTCSKFKSNVKFKEFTDHQMMFSKIYTKLKVSRRVDTGRLAIAIDEASRGVTSNKNLFLRKRLPNKDANVTLRENNKIVNPIKENLDLSPWYILYRHDQSKRIKKNYIPKILETKIKIIQSKAADVADWPIRKILVMLKGRDFKEIQKIMTLFKGNFCSRVVCLKKKNKVPDKVTNLRPIQISPLNFKIAEQSREKLKNWINEHTDPRCYAFKPNSSAENLFKDLKSKIVN